MENGLILSIATLVAFMAVGVQGTSHLSFASNMTQVNITRTGCGSSKLCVETPSSCDPAGNSSCLFTSIMAGTAMAPNGVNLTMQLSGNSSGYIAVGLRVSASEASTLLFVCAQNSSQNGTFFFRTMSLNNTDNTVTSLEQTVTEIRGMVDTATEKIQCEFKALRINASQARSKDTTFSVILGAGKLIAGALGAFTSSFTSDPLNVADPAANVAANTTQAPTNATQAPANMTTTSGASDAFHPNAVLLPLSVLALSFFKSA